MGVIDLQVLREQPDTLRASQERRGDPVEYVDAAIEADARRRAAVAAFEQLRGEQNVSASMVGKASKEERPALIAAAQDLARRVKEAQAASNEADAALEAAVNRIANVVIDLASATATSPDGEQSEHPFAVMAGIGLDAATMSATDSELKKRIGWVAYVGGLFKALQEVRQFTATGTLDDDQEKSFEANTVLIGNAGMLQGNVRMMPDAELDDGLLDIAIVNPGGALEWMQVMNEVVSISDPIQRELRKLDILPDRKKIRTLGFRQTSRIRLRLDEPVELQVDGDLIGEIVALDCRVRPDALTVKVRKRD